MVIYDTPLNNHREQCQHGDAMNRVIITGTSALLAAAERLCDAGEITEAQLEQMRERQKNISHDDTVNTVLFF